jgi:hypothetical protein
VLTPSSATPQAQVAPEPPKPAPVAQLAPQAPDPVASLKVHLMKLQAGPYGKEKVNDPKVVWSGDKWCMAVDVSFDVRQTQSLVSPYMADVTFLEMDHCYVERSRDATIRVGEDYFARIRLSLRYRAVLAMQQGLWVLKSLQCRIGDKWDDAESDSVTRIRTAMGVE